jgi:hypothetical protein
VELFLHLRAGAGPLEEAALQAAVAEGAALPRRGGPPVEVPRPAGSDGPAGRSRPEVTR